MGQVLSACLNSGNDQPPRDASRPAGQAYVAAPHHSEVLFFPDGQLPCRNMMNDGETNLVKLLKVLKAAKQTVDVCVFNITCDDIANTLAALHKQGVRVRIVTDDEQARSQGSDVRSLAQAGIPVVADNSQYHMHHKFAIVDGKLLVNGSLNWTVQAVQSNQENVVVTGDPALIKAFQGCFDQLWRQFSGNHVR